MSTLSDVKKTMTENIKSIDAISTKVDQFTARLAEENVFVTTLEASATAAKKAVEAGLHEYAGARIAATALDELQTAADRAERQLHNHQQAIKIIEETLTAAKTELAEANRSAEHLHVVFWKEVFKEEQAKMLQPAIRLLAIYNKGFKAPIINNGLTSHAGNYMDGLADLARKNINAETESKTLAALKKEYGLSI